ncbi:MAG: response regulator [Candidatus Riflebacteria bacterium]|nr:response regulator [Candidatus Riflebacteria bacterium]
MSLVGLELLLVEDSIAEARLVHEAFEEVGLRVNVHTVHDGETALAFLHREGPHADARRPHLVLLDWNLPKRPGWEVLRSIREDPHLGHLPVIVFTTSSTAEDAALAYEHGANCFVTKPDDLGRYLEVMGLMGKFWVSVARVPVE